MNKEAKVGLVVAMICCLMLALAPTQKKRTQILGTEYKLSFHSVEGLKPGDPVVLGGVPAGRVVSVDFADREDWGKLNPGQPDVPMVLATISVNTGIKIPKQTGYKIISTMKGKHFINMVPGVPGENYKSGETLTEELTPERDDKLGATFRNFRHLAKQTDNVRMQFSDPQFRRDIKDTASNARFYSQEFAGLSKNATGQVRQVSAQLEQQERALLAQAAVLDSRIDKAEVYMKQVIPAAKNQLAGYRKLLAQSQGQMDQVYKQSEKMSEQLRTFADKLDSSPLGKLDAKVLSKKAHELSTKMQDFADLSGDLHTISSDPQVQKEVKAYFTKFKTQSESLKATAEKYDGQLDGWKWLMLEEKEHSNEP
jgi:ABC-type transporter Mla subunit MlaD